MEYDPGHIFRRFGMGLRGRDQTNRDGHQWLRSQLDMPDPTSKEPGSTTANGILIGRNYEKAKKAGENLTYGMSDLYWDKMAAALQHAVTTNLPFRERLVWFWANHFTISGRADNDANLKHG